MKSNLKPSKLSLIQPASYQIKVQGVLSSAWTDYFDGFSVNTGADAHEPNITTLTGQLVDQATLLGTLNHLFNIGLPLISVECIHAQFRPSPSPCSDHMLATYRDHYMQLYLERGTAIIHGKQVDLTSLQLKLLTYLVQHRDQTVPKKELLAAVWGESYQLQAEYLHVYISQLRKKLEADPTNPQYLLTEYKVGYRFQSAPEHVY